MSAWYYLTDDRGHEEGCWNYTSNCNGMVRMALERADRAAEWPGSLNGLSGYDGARLLQDILRQFDATPEDFRALNPPNGWGDFDRFRTMLEEMMHSVPEWPTVWDVS